jgi:hypothetical protein
MAVHPDATVEVGARTLSVTSSEITGEENETAWARFLAGRPRVWPIAGRTQTAPADLHPGKPRQVIAVPAGHDLAIEVGC